MCYIYSYVNKDTGKTYIGSRCSYKGRPEDDFNIRYFSSSKNPEFIKDMSEGKLQGNIILEISDPDQCVKLENMMIKAYWEQYGKDKSYNRCCCIGKERQFNQYNKQGYWKGKHLNDECKQKLSLSHIGKRNLPEGFKHTQETIDKIKKSKQHKWIDKDGQIHIMDKGCVHRWHPDYIEII